MSKYDRYVNWKKKFEEADAKVRELKQSLYISTKDRESVKKCLEESRKKLKEELEEIMKIKTEDD